MYDKPQMDFHYAFCICTGFSTHFHDIVILKRCAMKNIKASEPKPLQCAWRTPLSKVYSICLLFLLVSETVIVFPVPCQYKCIQVGAIAKEHVIHEMMKVSLFLTTAIGKLVSSYQVQLSRKDKLSSFHVHRSNRLHLTCNIVYIHNNIIQYSQVYTFR